MMESFVARQPVFDRDRDVYGYELLFRSGPENCFSGEDGDHATSKLMSDSMSVHGLEALTAGSKAFVNVTRNVLVEGTYSILPPGRSVIEILEVIEPDDEVIDACKQLKREGYILALDDFVLGDRFNRLLPEVDILKIDFMDTTPEGRKNFSTRAKDYDFALLAEKVENYDEFEEAVGLGYSYFQGYFFCKPQMISAKEVPAFKLNYLRFLEQINQPELDLVELEEIIRQDVALSYKLLKYLNSAAFGMRNKVTSIKHAIALLGAMALQKWASLVAITAMGDDKPNELLNVSLNRARFCELVATETNLTNRKNDHFLIGMLSVVDAIMDRPMVEILQDLPVSEEIKSSLVGEDSELSMPFKLVQALERGHWNDVGNLCQVMDISDSKVMEFYRQSIEWTETSFGAASAQPAA